MKRKCSNCKEDKELSEFHRKGSGHSYMCKECRKIYIKNHYNNDKGYYIQKARETKRKIHSWYKEYKSTLKCSKCGENHPACLEFHHLDPNEKDVEVSRMIISGSLKRLQDEIAKCIVLCSNCHRKLHYGNSSD